MSGCSLVCVITLAQHRLPAYIASTSLVAMLLAGIYFERDLTVRQLLAADPGTRRVQLIAFRIGYVIVALFVTAIILRGVSSLPASH